MTAVSYTHLDHEKYKRHSAGTAGGGAAFADGSLCSDHRYRRPGEGASHQYLHGVDHRGGSSGSQLPGGSPHGRGNAEVPEDAEIG